MTFQSVPNVVEAVPHITMNGKEITLTFYGEIAGGYSAADVQNLADEMDDWAATELKPWLSVSGTYDFTSTRGLEFANDVIGLSSTGAGAGGEASQALPNNAVLSVKRRSGFTGRSARGRVYVPVAFGELSTNENYVSSGFAVGITAALDEVRVYMLNAGFTEVIVSRYTGGSLRATGVTFDVVDYSVVDTRIDSQRRRLP